MQSIDAGNIENFETFDDRSEKKKGKFSLKEKYNLLSETSVSVLKHISRPSFIASVGASAAFGLAVRSAVVAGAGAAGISAGYGVAVAMVGAATANFGITTAKFAISKDKKLGSKEYRDALALGMSFSAITGGVLSLPLVGELFQNIMDSGIVQSAKQAVSEFASNVDISLPALTGFAGISGFNLRDFFIKPAGASDELIGDAGGASALDAKFLYSRLTDLVREVREFITYIADKNLVDTDNRYFQENLSKLNSENPEDISQAIKSFEYGLEHGEYGFTEIDPYAKTMSEFYDDLNDLYSDAKLKVDTPQEPKADIPQEPKADIPQEPKADIPQEPKADIPQEPKADIPQEPKADSSQESVTPPQDVFVEKVNKIENLLDALAKKELLDMQNPEFREIIERLNSDNHKVVAQAVKDIAHGLGNGEYGFTENDRLAVVLSKLSLEIDNTNLQAQIFLGYHMLHGIGTDVDTETSEQLLRNVFEKGNPELRSQAEEMLNYMKKIGLINENPATAQARTLAPNAPAPA